MNSTPSQPSLQCRAAYSRIHANHRKTRRPPIFTVHIQRPRIVPRQRFARQPTAEDAIFQAERFFSRPAPPSPQARSSTRRVGNSAPNWAMRTIFNSEHVDPDVATFFPSMPHDANINVDQQSRPLKKYRSTAVTVRVVLKLKRAIFDTK